MKPEVLLACALLAHLFGNSHPIWLWSVPLLWKVNVQECAASSDPQGRLASNVPSVVTDSNSVRRAKAKESYEQWPTTPKGTHTSSSPVSRRLR